tara:strand:- start:1714 stop:1875 length:162 start_codon:yes stop_codon:yes gene_type:complete
MDKLKQNQYGGRYVWKKGSMVMDELNSRELRRMLKRRQRMLERKQNKEKKNAN